MAWRRSLGKYGILHTCGASVSLNVCKIRSNSPTHYLDIGKNGKLGKIPPSGSWVLSDMWCPVKCGLIWRWPYLTTCADSRSTVTVLPSRGGERSRPRWPHILPTTTRTARAPCSVTRRTAPSPWSPASRTTNFSQKTSGQSVAHATLMREQRFGRCCGRQGRDWLVSRESNLTGFWLKWVESEFSRW